ncbi:uncharacterized protein G6M90_00g091620 [Metarhizium brunneum]|uniref:Zinc finger PHD-type domain-containing protein n=1 Tax=Metarhizium brunneum TaxID=500148 RepID=A0A7D5Z4C4_9HYPO|nr:hypothetical protein G6M90_00g091620 [Metarhizium brunneum]
MQASQRPGDSVQPRPGRAAAVPSKVGPIARKTPQCQQLGGQDQEGKQQSAEKRRAPQRRPSSSRLPSVSLSFFLPALLHDLVVCREHAASFSALLRHDSSPIRSTYSLLFPHAILVVTSSHSSLLQVSGPGHQRQPSHQPGRLLNPPIPRKITFIALLRTLPISFLHPLRLQQHSASGALPCPPRFPPEPSLGSMAPPSPRRSSRARATNSQSQQSSSSSGTSGRLERSTRSVNKPSSEKSTPSASLSSEPLDDFDDTLLGRRRKRGQNDDTDRNSRSEITDMANGSDDLQDDEDEAVRCLCGSEDYPGPPPVDSPDAEIFAAIDLTDEVTGFFVQCDICKVWQHGACVGIFSAESSPDEYFCEQCRKDLHKIHTAANGQKYSKYLPLNRASRATSRATSIAKDDKNGSSKNSRPSTATQSSKRRSTMNSRDAAYDDEQLRRAIEASKEDNTLETVEGATRRAKRGRSDSEDNNNNSSIKRQRTSSRSPSPPAEKQEPVDEVVSDDETETRNGAKKSKNNQQPREKPEKEDRERQRQEAANKRKGRAERRRAEDSDLSEEMPLAASKAVSLKPAESPSKEESPSVAQAPGTPPPAHPTASSSHKRGARANKRGKGRNQYTKDRDQDDESPARSMSRDIQKGDEATTTGHSKSSVNEHKTSRAKASATNKMSMLDMKRRVAAIMEFISRTQVDLAAEASFSQSSSGRETPQEKPEPSQTNGNTVNGHTPDPFDMSRFKGLSCMEMMDVLTRVMVKWQNQYS